MCVNLGVALNEFGESVTLVDADFSASDIGERASVSMTYSLPTSPVALTPQLKLHLSPSTMS
ncbi:MAG: hypothetical protein ABEJ95_01980 [Candidatus Nanohalobium sp.]